MEIEKKKIINDMKVLNKVSNIINNSSTFIKFLKYHEKLLNDNPTYNIKEQYEINKKFNIFNTYYMIENLKSIKYYKNIRKEFILFKYWINELTKYVKQENYNKTILCLINFKLINEKINILYKNI